MTDELDAGLSFPLAGVGFIAVIHDNGNFPLAQLNGFLLESGQKHRLSYTKKKQYLLGPPYSVCTNKSPRLLQAVFDRISNADFEYEEYVCFEVCLQVYTYVSSTACVLVLRVSVFSPDTVDAAVWIRSSGRLDTSFCLARPM